mgnify:CR=1 FL=1
MNKSLIVVGSKSKHKLGAVGSALFHFGIPHTLLSCDVETDTPAQPCSWHQVQDGATRRAIGALRNFPEALVGVGIESGLFFVRQGQVLDIAFLSLVDNNGREFIATSQGVMFPANAVAEARSRGFKNVTAGQIIAERFGGDHTDPHTTLTEGRVTREGLLTDGLRALFAQYLACDNHLLSPPQKTL